jgi:hypothetical protein
LGGLIARYAIGQLYVSSNSALSCDDHAVEPPQEQPSQGTIFGLQPVNFVTVATPHIGSRGNRQVTTILNSFSGI